MKKTYQMLIDHIGGQSLDNLEETKFCELLDVIHINKTREIVQNLRMYICN